MEVTTMIYIAVAFVVGIILSALLKKDNTKVNELSTANEELKKQLADAEDKAKSIEYNSSNKVNELKIKYDALLQEAANQNEKLDQQLKSALSGKLEDSILEQLAEAEKLKKKIQNLEEELEDAEYDLADAKKKLKNREADITELQDCLGKEQKISKELSTELSSAKATLEEKIEELKLKMGSLDFMQEILSAKESSHSDVKQLENNISEMRSFALGQLIDCYATLDDYIDFGEGGFDSYKKHWQQRFDEWASVTKKSWINGKTTIAFVGEFSAGKTSIVNRILSQDDPNVPQLPVSTKATTAIATYIAGGPAISYQFVTPDDKLKSISQQTFTEKVSKEILDQVKGVSSLIKYFVMTYKNPNLNGLSILDTPGFNSNDKNDAERTMEVINECDALFCVFDVNAGTVNRSSITIIKENLNKPLYVVINKVDTKAASEVQKVENLIKKTLNDEGLKVEMFIRFSAKVALTDIMTPIKNVKHLSEKEQYLSDLDDSINDTLRELDSKVKQANEKYITAQSNDDKINDKFIQRMKSLYTNCDTAAGIPHYEEHLFRKNNFEMSQEECSRLCSILQQSCDDVEQMGEIYDEKTDSAFRIQKTWDELRKAETKWQRVNEIKNQFSKIKNKF